MSDSGLFGNAFRKETWSIAADFNHIAHPLTPTKEQQSYKDPEIWDRIGGSILFGFFLLLVVPGCFYLYWAAKKVEQIDISHKDASSTGKAAAIGEEHLRIENTQNEGEKVNHTSSSSIDPDQNKTPKVALSDEQASTKLQSFIRARQAYDKVETERQTLKNVLSYLSTRPTKDNTLPPPAYGLTPIRMPKNLPFVIKIPLEDNKTRFQDMEKARSLLLRDGFKHLIIPQARVQGEFLIEQRLNIRTQAGVPDNIGFYLNHVNQFTDAVKEFTELLYRTELPDIFGGTTDFYSSLAPFMGRYDNVCLYLEEKEGKTEGKIGLIDLDGFVESPQDIHKACTQAITLFPLHLDAILEVAHRLDPSIDLTPIKPLLEQKRKEVLDYFDKAYGIHHKFIIDNRISDKNFTKISGMSESRKAEIEKQIKQKIFSNSDVLNQLGRISSEDIDIIKDYYDQYFPIILDLTIKDVENQLQKKPISEEFLSQRTLGLSMLSIEENGLFKHENYKPLNKEFLERSFIKMIVGEVGKEWEQGGEIARYRFYEGQHFLWV